MFNQPIDLTQLPVSPNLTPDPSPEGEGGWRVGFGLFLRNTPSQKRRKRAALTLQAYERDMNLMATWFEAKYEVAFEPSQLNIQNVGEYFAQFENEPATHKRKLASLRLFVRWGMEAELIEEDPTIWIATMDAVEEDPRDLTDGEREQLEAAAEAGEESLLGMRDSVLFFLMNDGGLRISEAIGVLLCDVHLDEGYIHVTGKGSKRRRVRIGSRLVGKIRRWVGMRITLTPTSPPTPLLKERGEETGETLITDERRFGICRQTAWTRFVLLREAAGVKATPHSMRHTYVKRLMSAYVKEYMKMTNNIEMAFHKALKTVCLQTGDDIKTILKYYSNPSESEIRAAVEAM